MHFPLNAANFNFDFGKFRLIHMPGLHRRDRTAKIIQHYFQELLIVPKKAGNLYVRQSLRVAYTQGAWDTKFKIMSSVGHQVQVVLPLICCFSLYRAPQQHNKSEEKPTNQSDAPANPSPYVLYRILYVPLTDGTPLCPFSQQR